MVTIVVIDMMLSQCELNIILYIEFILYIQNGFVEF